MNTSIKVLEAWEAKDAVASHLESLYSVGGGSRPNFYRSLFSNISHEMASLLERAFAIEEVEHTLSKCNGDKALDPDGYDFSSIKVGESFSKEIWRCLISSTSKKELFRG